MADMTNKHHRLIQDAIVDGVMDVFVDKHVQQKVIDCNPGNIQLNYRMRVMAEQITRVLCRQFADRMVYTHDKFDKSAFINQTMTMVKERLNALLRQWEIESKAAALENEDEN